MQPSLRIGLCLLLLASLPFSHCIAFFSNDKLNENYLLSSFSDYLSASFPGIGFHLHADQKMHQNIKINLTTLTVCPGDFCLIFSRVKPSSPAFTNIRRKFNLINSDPIADKHFCGFFCIDKLSCEKRNLTSLFQIFMFTDDLHSTCNAHLFELCKKSNDEGRSRFVSFKYAIISPTNHQNVRRLSKTISPTTHIHCE